jgi:hypothetical protein
MTLFSSFSCSLKNKLGQAVTVLRMYHHKVCPPSNPAAMLHYLLHLLHSSQLSPLPCASASHACCTPGAPAGHA